MTLLNFAPAFLILIFAIYFVWRCWYCEKKIISKYLSNRTKSQKRLRKLTYEITTILIVVTIIFVFSAVSISINLAYFLTLFVIYFYMLNLLLIIQKIHQVIKKINLDEQKNIIL